MPPAGHVCDGYQAGWTHQDGDTYVTEDVFRSPCSASNPGESHGICDGFGTCQCAPPFIGDDCSIKVRENRVPDGRDLRVIRFLSSVVPRLYSPSATRSVGLVESRVVWAARRGP